jgi:hypothetical protein
MGSSGLRAGLTSASMGILVGRRETARPGAPAGLRLVVERRSRGRRRPIVLLAPSNATSAGDNREFACRGFPTGRRPGSLWQSNPPRRLPLANAAWARDG